MDEWYRCGYFNLNLLLKRAEDEGYVQLQELSKLFGGIPFVVDTIIPPIKVRRHGEIPQTELTCVATPIKF